MRVRRNLGRARGGDADCEAVDSHESPARAARRSALHLASRVADERGRRRLLLRIRQRRACGLCATSRTRVHCFGRSDWQHYQDVNRKFADALLEEMEDVSNPVVLVQDYHFALLPRMIKQKRPDARVAIFWHIPWPNPEAFGICPWQRELVDGLLGADLIGFHIQSHCTNFLQTVDRIVESRIDWDHFDRAAPVSIAHWCVLSPSASIWRDAQAERVAETQRTRSVPRYSKAWESKLL